WPWSTDIRKTFNYHITESLLLQQEARKPHFVPENGSLISDWRYLKKPLLFGLPIGNRPQGYGFSLWTISNR
ncbi:MAG: hypothetical protein ACKPE8_15415, partial [Dolichospermum sp.]